MFLIVVLVLIGYDAACCVWTVLYCRLLWGMYVWLWRAFQEIQEKSTDSTVHTVHTWLVPGANQKSQQQRPPSKLSRKKQKKPSVCGEKCLSYSGMGMLK